MARGKGRGGFTKGGKGEKSIGSKGGSVRGGG